MGSARLRHHRTQTLENAKLNEVAPGAWGSERLCIDLHLALKELVAEGDCFLIQRGLCRVGIKRGGFEPTRKFGDDPRTARGSNASETYEQAVA